MERRIIPFNAKVEPIRPLNDEFTLCKVYICALDKNRNKSYIGKDAADKALPTLYNCPVVGHIYADEDGKYHMGGHDFEIEKATDGTYRFKSLCVPYGVIPQQDNVHYEEIEDANGNKQTYVVGDCILWTGRFDCLKNVIYSKDCWFGQSMEINIKDYCKLEEDNSYDNILEYTYSALCLLGKSDSPEYHVEPCFPDAKVAPYEFALDDNFTELMQQLKEDIASCFANNEKGGYDMEENSTNATVITEEPQVNGQTVDAAADVTTPAKEEEFDNNATAEDVLFSTTHRELEDALRDALPHVEERDDDGNLVREIYFWLVDFDDTHAFVERSEYTKENTVDTYGRLTYSYNADEHVATVADDFEEMFVTWLTKEERDQLEAQREQYEILVAYKDQREQQDHNAAIDSALSEFSDLEGNEAFAEVVANKYNYDSAEDIKNACYVIRGKFSYVPRQSGTGTPNVPIGIQIGENETNIFEGFFNKYGNKNGRNNRH